MQQEAVLGAPGSRDEAAAGRPPLPVSAGTIIDASPHLLVLATDDDRGGRGDRELRIPMTTGTSIWFGGRAGLPALRPGRRAIVRAAPDGPAADRVWVDIARVTGTIVSYGGGAVEVDAGPHRGHTQVVIPKHALVRVLVRHPRMEPGHLIDVICTRSPDGPRAARPGTSQPGHPAGQAPEPPLGMRAAGPLRGTATWYGGPVTGEGAAYPAIDPEGEADACPDAPRGCTPLPYLSRGGDLLVRNDCTGRAAAVPVVECGCVAARYCDRCVECGTSPRGRVVELTAASFAGLGGDLDAGCFNTTLTVGW